MRITNSSITALILVTVGLFVLLILNKYYENDSVHVSNLQHQDSSGVLIPITLEEEYIPDVSAAQEDRYADEVTAYEMSNDGQAIYTTPEKVTVEQISDRAIQPEQYVTALQNEWQPLSNESCKNIGETSSFYHNPKSQVVKVEKDLRSSGEVHKADLIREISCYPQAAWLAQSDTSKMRTLAFELTSAAEKAGQVPVFALYNAAQGNSIDWAFGNQGQDYIDWISAVAEGIGNRAVWIILEPDAVGMTGSYNQGDRAYRLSEIKKAVSILKTKAPNAHVYIDAANSGWWRGDFKAELLKDAGIELADGFSLNVANYHSLANEIRHGEEISKALGGNVHFVIDTGRNGNGSDGGWCNLPYKSLGVKPTQNTGHTLVDAYLWIKPPGESDGICEGGPTPGKFWLEYALTLVERSL